MDGGTARIFTRIYFRGNQCNRNEAHDPITGKVKIQFRMVFFSSAEVYGDYEGRNDRRCNGEESNKI